MMARLVIIVSLLAGLMYGIWTLRDDGQGDADVAALVRAQAQRRTDAAQRLADAKDLDILTPQGLAVPPPSDMVSGIDAKENVWFVGNPDDPRVGVELPFQPGTLPLPPKPHSGPDRNPGFLGAQACQSCHRDKYDTFIQTAHHRTSRIVSPENLASSFDPGHNELHTSVPDVSFRMVQLGQRYYQRAKFFDWQFDVPMDLVVGSAKMAESYLYWHGDRLFQAHCTYLTTDHRWINSPGYQDGNIFYNRPIATDCIDCHVTYVDLIKPLNTYRPESLILGISCERCHGPGREHVAYHQDHPDAKEAKFMCVPSELSRQAEMDVCGQCHTDGKLLKDKAGFQFRPGDRLEDFYVAHESKDESKGSVHTSNQADRLSLSACFQDSSMGCVDCHDPHKNERGQAALFSQRCMQCHSSQQCAMVQTHGESLAENCIDCHMPRRETSDLHLETADGKIFPPLRDHYIRIDADATESMLQQLGLANASLE